MKNLVVVLFCVAAAFFAVAAKEGGSKPEIPAEDCRYLVAHHPAPDVEYKPGVDVHGKPVVEAEVSPPVIQPPEKYVFDLTVDVAKYIGLEFPAGVEGKTGIGKITVEKGKILFNGQPLEGDAEAALVALCAPEKQSD